MSTLATEHGKFVLLREQAFQTSNTRVRSGVSQSPLMGLCLPNTFNTAGLNSVLDRYNRVLFQ